MTYFVLEHSFLFKNILFIYLAALGLRCSIQTLGCRIWDLVPRPGIELRTPALGAWSLNQ